MKRIVALGLILGLTLCACGPQISRTELVLPPKGSEVNLVVATDLHFISPKLVKEGTAFQKAYLGGDGKQLNYIDPLVDVFVAEMAAQKPSAVLLTGDLTLNGEKASHQDLAKRLGTLRAMGIPVLVIPGNHDINNAFAAGYKGEKPYNIKGVTPEEFAQIYGELGYGDAMSRDPASLSYMAQLSEELWVVMLDTNKYDARGGFSLSEVSGVLSPQTMTWLEEQLREAQEKGVKVISATHHNLMDHSGKVRTGYTLDNAQEVLELYRRYGVRVNFSGHIHIQSIAKAEVEGEDIYDIATSSYAVYTNQYGVVRYRPGESLDYHTQEADVEGWAAAVGSKDPNLLGFEKYSYQFFYDAAYGRSYSNLYMAQLGPKANLERMAVTMALLNPAYFSGRAGEIREEVLASDHYAMWREYDGMAPIEYIDSMLEVPELEPCSIQMAGQGL